MAYFPILSAPYCQGETTVYNFSPNNWEVAEKIDQYLYLTFAYEGVWHNLLLNQIGYGNCHVLSRKDLTSNLPDDVTPFISLSKSFLEKTSKELPDTIINKTNFPQYRSSLGLVSQHAKTSYQGELTPFSSRASLLTFAPFLQFGNNIENYILIVNLEISPKKRIEKLEIYDARKKKLCKQLDIYSNHVNIISLDDMGFNIDDLPVIICRGMASVPIYFSVLDKGKSLSLEHTNPPASLVILGNRFGVQNYLKNYWFLQCQPI